jgi:RNA polymerase sigma factor (sigma-70 family)
VPTTPGLVPVLDAATPEALVVELTQARYAPAFEELYRRHAPVIWNYLYRLTDGNRPVADDLAQDTWLKAWLAVDRTAPGLRFRAWLYRIATNTWRDHVRHARLVRFVPLAVFSASEAGAEGSPEVADGGWGMGGWGPHHQERLTDHERGANPEASLDDAEAEAEVRAVLDALPARYAAVLDGYDGGGAVTYGALAASRGETVAAIKSALYRARQAFGAEWRCRERAAGRREHDQEAGG